MEQPLRSKIGMVFTCLFLGGFGIHRLRMGYKNWWLMLITLGGLGIWTFIDFVRLIKGNLKMANGATLI